MVLLLALVWFSRPGWQVGRTGSLAARRPHDTQPKKSQRVLCGYNR
jgi:hypothetical protein